MCRNPTLPKTVDDHPPAVYRHATPLARYGAMGKARVASSFATVRQLHHLRGHDLRDLMAESRSGLEVASEARAALAELGALDPGAAAVFRRAFAAQGVPSPHPERIGTITARDIE